MTHDTYMKTDMLYEYAALDALGMLDDVERDTFTRTFNDAPKKEQDAIRELQATYAADPLFQANEGPSSALRSRVIDHVLETHARAEASKHAPLATIGRNSAYPRVSASEMASMSRTLRMWRAATLALAASLIFGLFLYFNAVSTSEELGIAALNSNTEDKLRELIGPTFEEFAANPNVTSASLRPAESHIPGTATMYVNDQTQQGFLLAVDLVQGQSYTLQMRVDDEIVHEVLTFQATGIYVGRRIESLDSADYDLQSFTNVAWEIVNEETGEVVLLA